MAISNGSAEPTRAMTARNGHPSLDVVVSMMTGPFLLGLIGARAIADGLTQLGLASEELFRGERLPTLHPPSEPSDAADP